MKLGSFLLLAASLSAGAAPESFVFVREGRVYFQPAGSDRAAPVIADDPGWEYAHPTWLDGESIVVLRNRGGQWGRSNVGVLAVGARPVSPRSIRWLPKLAGAYAVGLAPDGGISYVKLAPTGEEEVTVYLGSASTDGATASSRPAYTAMYGVGEAVRNGLRASWDGLVSVPTFPTDVSNQVAAWNWARRRFEPLDLLNYEWLAARDIPAEWASMAFGGNRWVALGSLRLGLWLGDREQGTIRPVDTWPWREETLVKIPAISFAWNTDCFYYEVTTESGDGRTTSEIRRAQPDGGRPTVVVRDGTMPDIMPPVS